MSREKPVASGSRASPPRITTVNSEVLASEKFKERSKVPLLPALDKQGAKVDMVDRMMVSKLNKLAPIVYSAEGKKTSKQLWQETMAKLTFAKLYAILEDLAK
ncbi:hypothetical protein PspLS_10277 [Pyricularia sp. CBS 133598]|nr:hypothetical protein PspLS_10277 [Pyricularia sp. CBS 133598]